MAETDVKCGCQNCLNGPHRRERVGAVFAMSLINQHIITEYGTCDFCHRSDVIVARFTPGKEVKRGKA
jgi:hypothetical protein